VEQPVNLDDDDDVFNYPLLYAVRPGEWELTDTQAAKFHEYLRARRLFHDDDFWGSFEWDVFMRSMRKVWSESDPRTSTTPTPSSTSFSI